MPAVREQLRVVAACGTIKQWCASAVNGMLYAVPPMRRARAGGGMADAADLKSAPRKGVRVRIPPGLLL